LTTVDCPKMKLLIDVIGDGLVDAWKNTVCSLIEQTVTEFGLNVEEVITPVHGWGDVWAEAHKIPVFEPPSRIADCIEKCDGAIVFWDGHVDEGMKLLQALKESGKPFWAGRVAIMMQMHNVDLPVKVEEKDGEQRTPGGLILP
jgi:hypothetical protein